MNSVVRRSDMRVARFACALALLLAVANGQAEAEAPAAAPETSAAAGAQAGVAAPAASPAAAAPTEQPAATTSGQAVGISPAATAPSAFGGTPAATPKVRNVLLISVDGLHSQDLSNFIAQKPGSTLASLVQSGVVYPNAYLPGPSDSYPGIVALTSGTNATVSGVYYDDSYDRTLYPPGSCAQLRTGSPEGPAGTETAYTEAMDYNLYSIAGLNGTGAFNGPSTNVTTLQSDYPAGGFNGSALNESSMPVDIFCNPVHPYTFNKAESIFQIASSAGMTTAWVDKTPIYEIVQGSQGNGVTDLYTPEIACLCGNPQVQGAPDTSIVDGSGIDLAKNVTAVQQYDQTHVNAVLNQINGTRSNGIGSLPSVPRLFGLNFQAVSVGQKYAGYTNASGGFSSGLLTTLNYVDRSIGTIYQALINRGLTPSTAIIITAKHGQQPIFPNATLVSPTPLAAALASANISVAQFTSDDIGLIWLNQQNQSTAAINTLRSLAANQSYGIQAVNTAGYYGLNSNVAGRTPDVVIVPLPGVVYSSPTAKLEKVSEHGGLMKADLNVALAVVLPPGSSAAGTTVNDTVNVQQVAATALSLLGLPLSSLTAGAANPLPGLGTSPASAAAPTAATLPLASSTASGAAAAAALAPAVPAAVSSAGAVVAPAGANQANPATPAGPKPEAAG